MKHTARFDATLFLSAANTHMLKSVTIAPAPSDTRPVKFVVTSRDEHGLGKLTRLLTAEWLDEPREFECGEGSEWARGSDEDSIVESVGVRGRKYDFHYALC